MTTTLGLAEAKAKLSAVVDDVHRTARRYVILRHGKPVAAVVGLEDLKELEQSKWLGPGPAGALALVGLWSDVEDEAIDQFVEQALRSRAEDRGRPVPLEP